VISNGVGADSEAVGEPGCVLSLNQEPKDLAFTGAQAVMGGENTDKMAWRPADLTEDGEHHPSEALGAGLEQ
jgi:hypothetical protein